MACVGRTWVGRTCVGRTLTVFWVTPPLDLSKLVSLVRVGWAVVLRGVVWGAGSVVVAGVPVFLCLNLSKTPDILNIIK